MSVVVIGGGNVKNAVDNAESASVTMTEAQRANLVALFNNVAAQINDFAAHPKPAT